MAKRQVRVSKPNLHHEPSNGPESPLFRAERPKRKKQPGETRGRDAHEKNEFSCHGTEREDYDVIRNHEECESWEDDAGTAGEYVKAQFGSRIVPGRKAFHSKNEVQSGDNDKGAIEDVPHVGKVDTPPMLYGGGVFLQSKSRCKDDEENFEGIRRVEIFVCDGTNENVDKERKLKTSKRGIK